MIADANALLALVLPDRPGAAAIVEMSAKASCARAERIRVTEPALVEMAWVLRSRYGLRPQEVVAAIDGVLSTPGVEAIEPVRARDALRLMSEVPALSFADCLLLETALERSESVLSFDRRLAKTALTYVALG